MSGKFKGVMLDGCEARLTCPVCFRIFDVDPSIEENLKLIQRKDGTKVLCAKCPGCGAEETPDAGVSSTSHAKDQT
jgi:hypothetical protein